MIDTATAAILFQRIKGCLEAAQTLKNLLQVVAASWNILEHVLCPSERKAVLAKRLRKDLMAIYRELRDAYFFINNQNLLPTNDFVTHELAKVIDAMERACAKPTNDELVQELEVVMEKAYYVHKYLSERLPNYPSAPPAEMTAHDSQNLMPALSTKARMVAQALQMHPAMACDAENGTDDAGLSLRIVALRKALGAPACLSERSCPSLHQAASVATSAMHYSDKLAIVEDCDWNYDSAAESDDDAEDDTTELDDGYVSADEDAFWKAARCHFLCGRGITPTGSGKQFGVPLARPCTPQQINEALRELGEEPQWRPVREGLSQHASHNYCAVVNYRSSGIVCVQGNGAEHLARDLDRVVELLKAPGSYDQRIVVREGDRVKLIKYSGSSGFYFDASHALDDLDSEDDDL